MGKKKEKAQIINNIAKLNLEIDYDKLATAIVNAEQEAQISTEGQKEEIPKLSICDTFKLIGHVICNKAESNGTMTSSLISMVLSLVFNAFAIFCLIFTGIGIFIFVYTIIHYDWNIDTIASNVVMLISGIIFAIIAATIAFIFRAVANEIGKEKDRNYVVSVFSAFVAFVALVVTVINTINEVM